MKVISFDVSSALVTNSGKVHEPDKDGIYKDVPLMVLGKASRNNKWYDPDGMVECLVNTNSAFYRRLHGGQLFGELGHPIILNEKDNARVLLIDMDRVSHQIHRVYTGQPTEKGHIIVYGDIEPCNPKGYILTESFQNPRRNTAFSLRSIVSKIGERDGIILQKPLAITTFDFVDCPGYAEASKVNVGAEGYSIEINPAEHLEDIMQTVGCESIEDQQILDIFESDKVSILTQLRGFIDQRTASIITNGEKVQLFHKIFK